MENNGTESIEAEFDRLAYRYQGDRPWLTDETVNATALDLLSGHKIGRLLDAGGGTGALAARLAERYNVSSLLVVDASAEMLQLVPRGFATVQSKIEDLDLGTRQFDTILLRQVLHYVDNPSAVLRKLVQLLDSGGLLYIGQIVAPDPASSTWLDSVAKGISHHRKRIWTLPTLLHEIAFADLKLMRAILHPFADSLRSWCSRGITVNSEQLDRMVADAVSSLNEETGRLLHVECVAGDMCFEALWVHILLQREAVPS